MSQISQLQTLLPQNNTKLLSIYIILRQFIKNLNQNGLNSGQEKFPVCQPLLSSVDPAWSKLLQSSVIIGYNIIASRLQLSSEDFVVMIPGEGKGGTQILEVLETYSNQDLPSQGTRPPK